MAALLVLATPAMAQADEAPKENPQPAAPVTPAEPVPVAPPAPAPAIPTPAQAEPENILYLDLSTGGRVKIQLYPQQAPAHVERIKALTREGFYNGVVFHRVIPGEIAQGGDPTGTGRGSSKLPDMKAEFNKVPHLRGTLSMARATDINSANSQFFIVYTPTFFFDGKYTAFGRVIGGMQFVDMLAPGEPPSQPSKILQASIAADNKPEPNYAAAIAAQPAEPVIGVSDLSGN